jgi:hypothetical protein
MPKLPNHSQIAELNALNEQVHYLTRSRPSRKKNWRILSVWREFRKHGIEYQFQSKDQITALPLLFWRSAFTVSVQRISIPGSSIGVDYYSVCQHATGVRLSLYCINGIDLIKKLLRFSFLNYNEMKIIEEKQRYEPYRYCEVCGERNKTYDRHCSSCNSPLY